MSVPNYKDVLYENARELRKNMTRHEKRLWYQFLRHYTQKFYRQRVVGNFILDFYCVKAHLAIEIDGAQHYTESGEKYDNRRSEILKERGIEVLRFSNFEIDSNFEGVCMAIDMAVKKRTQN